MNKVNLISGGKTSAYIASEYEADYNVFSLVRINDNKSKFPDRKIAKLIEDRIQAPFIATAEDDMIIYTILDLEDNMINKWNINDDKKYNISYNRVPKRKTQL